MSVRPNVDGEASLALRSAVGAHYSPEARDTWMKMSGGPEIDLEPLIEEATRLHLAPLLHATLKMHQPRALEEIPDRLSGEYYSAASYNLILLRELARVLTAFDEAQVAVIVLKGSAVLDLAYHDIGMRPMGDLDLLIDHATLPRAEQVLAESGYVKVVPVPFDDASGLCWNELTFSSAKDPRIMLELHWQLIDIPYFSVRMPAKDLFGRSIERESDGMSYRTLSIEDQIIHLCAHDIYHHLGQTVRGLVDIALIIRACQESINWNRLLSLAREAGLRWSVGQCLVRANEGWFVDIPADVLNTLGTGKSSIRDRFFIMSQRSEYLKVVRTLLTLPGLGLRFQFAKGLLAPDREYLTLRYGLPPTTSNPVAYGRRLWHGLRGLMAELLGSARRDSI